MLHVSDLDAWPVRDMLKQRPGSGLFIVPLDTD